MAKFIATYFLKPHIKTSVRGQRFVWTVYIMRKHALNSEMQLPLVSRKWRKWCETLSAVCYLTERRKKRTRQDSHNYQFR